MLARLVNSVFAALLLAFLLLVQEFSTILSKFGAAVCEFLVHGPLRYHSPRNLQYLEHQAGEEFAFEHAIEAYERLIDAAYAQRRA